MTHPSDMAVLVERLRALLAKAKDAQHCLSLPGEPAYPIEQDRKASTQAALEKAAVDALPTLLDALSTDQRTGQEVSGEVDVPLAFYAWLAGIERDVCAHELTPHEIAALIAALAKAAPPVEATFAFERNTVGRVEIKADDPLYKAFRPKPETIAAIEQNEAANAQGLAAIRDMMVGHVTNWPEPKKFGTAIALVDKTLNAALQQSRSTPGAELVEACRQRAIVLSQSYARGVRKFPAEEDAFINDVDTFSQEIREAYAPLLATSPVPVDASEAFEQCAQLVEAMIPEAAGGPFSHTNTIRVVLYDAVKAIRARALHAAPAAGEKGCG